MFRSQRILFRSHCGNQHVNTTRNISSFLLKQRGHARWSATIGNLWNWEVANGVLFNARADKVLFCRLQVGLNRRASAHEIAITVDVVDPRHRWPIFVIGMLPCQREKRLFAAIGMRPFAK
jgi:hypothetical protein